MLRILQIGPYSSVGGINQNILHIKSLIEDHYLVNFLDESPMEEWDHEVENIRSISVVQYIKLIKSCDIVHIHTPVWWLRCLHIITSKVLSRRIVVTIHSWKYQRKFRADFIATKFCLLFADKIVYVNKDYEGFLNLNKSKAQFMPAFIPVFSNKELDTKGELQHFLDQGKKIISANSFRLDLYNNKDLYGLDICIEVARLFKRNCEDFAIIFIVASLKGKSLQLYKKYSDIIKNERLEDYILIYPRKIDFVALIEKSDLVIRPTLTDGDALTIREALYKNVPVVASDVIQRPKGTILFKNRDPYDLYSKIKGISNGSIKLKKHDMPSFDSYYNFYNNLYSTI